MHGCESMSGSGEGESGGDRGRGGRSVEGAGVDIKLSSSTH